MAADQERADRIRALKLERPDLTWRRIADYVGVSERAATDWQKKGGIGYANAEKLARLFEVDVDYIWRGTENTTPSPFAEGVASENQVEGVAVEFRERVDATFTQLDRIEGRLDEARSEQDRISGLIDKQTQALEEQAGVLRELRDAVMDLRETISMQQAAARHLEEMTQAAVDALPAPAARAPRKARTGTRSGS